MIQAKRVIIFVFLIVLLSIGDKSVFARQDLVDNSQNVQDGLLGNTKSTDEVENYKIASAMPFVISNNKFVTNKRKANKVIFGVIEDKAESRTITDNSNKLLKIIISKEESLYDEIRLDKESISLPKLEDLNNDLSLEDPTEDLLSLGYTTPEINPTVNRIKNVYFLTSLSTAVGQSTQIEDAFVKGKKLTGGGVSKGEYYGYENVFRNLINPIGRSIAGSKADDSGNTVNFTLHPLFGFGIMSYMVASGASAKEAFLVTLADNFIFENVVEGTYVAPSGLDLLTTTGGSVIGYFASKYIFKKPFQAIIKKSASIKNKFGIEVDPIVEPGYYGKGMKIGSRIQFGK